MQRKAKQAIIVFLYIFITLLFFGGIFWAFFYQRPSCLDGKQNQDETGVDCGGVCSEYCIADLASEPLSITEVQTLPYTEDSSDAVGTVANKNAKAALKKANYTFTLYDQSGAVLAEQGGVFSLLPLESRTLSAFGLGIPDEKVGRSELKVSNEEWVAFVDFVEPPDIRIVNQEFNFLSGQAGFAEAKGLVQNESPYDIRTLTVMVVLRDKEGEAVSVNRTTLNTLRSGENRDFRLVWPQAFSGVPQEVDMQVHFDVLAEDAFVKQFFPGGKFQSLTPGS